MGSVERHCSGRLIPDCILHTVQLLLDPTTKSAFTGEVSVQLYMTRSCCCCITKCSGPDAAGVWQSGYRIGIGTFRAIH